MPTASPPYSDEESPSDLADPCSGQWKGLRRRRAPHQRAALCARPLPGSTTQGPLLAISVNKESFTNKLYSTKDRTRYLQSRGATVVGSRLFESLPQHPLVTVKSTVKICDTTKPTAAKAIGSLCDAGILEEITGRGRDRTYAYTQYLDLLREGTELEG